MTSIVVWKLFDSLDGYKVVNSGVDPKGKSQICLIADTRATAPNIIANQATKILSLSAITHIERNDHLQSFLSLGIAFAYSGEIFPALMTHAALNNILSNIGRYKGTSTKVEERFIPSLEKIANLTAFILKKYVEQYRNGISKPSESGIGIMKFPHCQIILVGLPYYSEGYVDYVGYSIGTVETYNSFECEVKKIDINKINVFGDKCNLVMNKINEFLKIENSGREPLLGLEYIIKESIGRSIGGVLQFALLSGNSLEIASPAGDDFFLDFNLKDDLEKIIDFEIPINKIFRSVHWTREKFIF